MAKTLYRLENIALASLLRELREQAGLIQEAFGQRIGRGQTYVSNVELGIRRLDLVELRDYCAGLGVPLADLVKRWEARLVAPTTKGRARKRASK